MLRNRPAQSANKALSCRPGLSAIMHAGKVHLSLEPLPMEYTDSGSICISVATAFLVPLNPDVLTTQYRGVISILYSSSCIEPSLIKMMPLAEPSAMVDARPPVEENGQDLPLTRETLAENLLRQSMLAASKAGSHRNATPLILKLPFICSVCRGLGTILFMMSSFLSANVVALHNMQVSTIVINFFILTNIVKYRSESSCPYVNASETDFVTEVGQYRQ